VVAALLGTPGATAAASTDSAPQRFRIHVHQDGVYRIDYERLQTAGLRQPLASATLRLESQGRAVPLRIDDGDDAEFGAGDHFSFIGERLQASSTSLHGYSDFNVYWLVPGAEGETPTNPGADRPMPLPEDAPALPELHTRLHLEQDLLRIAPSGMHHRGMPDTLWYWLQLNHLASEPTRIPLDLSRRVRDSGQPMRLSLQFRGGSDYASSANLTIPDHRVEILLNGIDIGRAEWSGRGVHRVDLELPPSVPIRPDSNELQLRIPLRRHGEREDPVIDVVQLDWIRADFAHDRRIDRNQQRVWLPADRDAAKGQTIEFSAASDMDQGPVRVFGPNGFFATIEPERSAASEATSPDGASRFRIPMPNGESSLWLVPEGRLLTPTAIVAAAGENIAGRTSPVDYFIIAHDSLIEALPALAEFHRTRGLQTEIIDVQDLYDEFSFGIRHPEAIRRFLEHARRTRAGTPASHVLLVGDADWFSGARGTVPGEFGNRDLIPTWYLPSRDGPAASDHPYVALEDDPLLPSMAIGRFPVSEPAAVRAIVDKTLAYLGRPEAGPWRSRVLLVSEAGRNMAARNELLAQQSEAAALRPLQLLAGDSGDPAAHQAQLGQAFDDGALLLHFYGHGGRFMWQTTSPRGGSGAHLFGIEDLDRLRPSRRLPIVLSMSCATGPFDHPQADSLAETLLRLEDRGAIAVVAASARNSPSVQFTRSMMDGMLGGETLGRSIAAAKRAGPHPDAVLLYNLFGDPALRAARPELSLELSLLQGPAAEVRVRIPAERFRGTAFLEWHGSDAGLRLEQQIELDTVEFDVAVPPGKHRRLGIHVLDPTQGLDGSGAIELPL
jgi:hypothetical protein